MPLEARRAVLARGLRVLRRESCLYRDGIRWRLIRSRRCLLSPLSPGFRRERELARSLAEMLWGADLAGRMA